CPRSSVRRSRAPGHRANEPNTADDGTVTGLPRRRFLVGGGAAAVTALVGVSCSDDDDASTPEPASSSSTSAPERARQFFTVREAAIVEAATSRILPGTPEDPGAREAEVVVYIDALLASGGWANEPIYRMPPFVTSGEDDACGASGDETSGAADSEGDILAS